MGEGVCVGVCEVLGASDITDGGWCNVDDGFGSYYRDVWNKEKKI